MLAETIIARVFMYFQHLSHRRGSGVILFLKRMQSNMIQRADKGGAIFIQNTDKYTVKVKTMLSDSSCYKKLMFNPTVKYKSQLEKMLNRGFKKKLDNRTRIQII